MSNQSYPEAPSSSAATPFRPGPPEAAYYPPVEPPEGAAGKKRAGLKPGYTPTPAQKASQWKPG